MRVSLTLLDLDGLGPRLWAGARYAVCIPSVFVTAATQEMFFSWQLQKVPESKANHTSGFDSFLGLEPCSFKPLLFQSNSNVPNVKVAENYTICFKWKGCMDTQLGVWMYNSDIESKELETIPQPTIWNSYNFCLPVPKFLSAATQKDLFL